jgi:hypothetical protein
VPIFNKSIIDSYIVVYGCVSQDSKMLTITLNIDYEDIKYRVTFDVRIYGWFLFERYECFTDFIGLW